MKPCTSCGRETPIEERRKGKCILCNRQHERERSRERRVRAQLIRAAQMESRRAAAEDRYQEALALIERDEARPDWHLQASCRNMTEEQADAAFVPEHGRVTKQVRALCESCPVRPDCIITGLKDPVDKNRTQDRVIWGGLRPSQLERAREDLAEQKGLVIEPSDDTFHPAPSRSGGTDLSRALDAVAGDPAAVVDVVARHRESTLANITTG